LTATIGRLGNQQPTGPHAVAGLARRHDHGNNFTANHFPKKISFRDMALSRAFVREPATNGVIERLFRTLKGQAIHGHVFQTINAVCDAVRYNADWLIEKNGYRSLLDTRAVCLEHVPVERAHSTRSSLLIFDHLYPFKRFRLNG